MECYDGNKVEKPSKPRIQYDHGEVNDAGIRDALNGAIKFGSVWAIPKNDENQIRFYIL